MLSGHRRGEPTYATMAATPFTKCTAGPSNAPATSNPLVAFTTSDCPNELWYLAEGAGSAAGEEGPCTTDPRLPSKLV